MFKSALMPLRLVFKTKRGDEEGEYVVCMV